MDTGFLNANLMRFITEVLKVVKQEIEVGSQAGLMSYLCPVFPQGFDMSVFSGLQQ